MDKDELGSGIPKTHGCNFPHYLLFGFCIYMSATYLFPLLEVQDWFIAGKKKRSNCTMAIRWLSILRYPPIIDFPFRALIYNYL
jgi:hypothetical protein